MKRYAMLQDEETKRCAVGLGPDGHVYERMGMTLMEVEEGPDGNWYLAGCAPAGPTEAELLARAKAQKAAEFDAAMSAVDARLIRPLANAESGRVEALNGIQAANRARRAQMLAARSLDEVRAAAPLTARDLAPENAGAPAGEDAGTDAGGAAA